MVEAAEITSTNKLELIVKDSGLDTTKSKYILDKFTDYFKIAAEWETKARSIIVTDASQKTDMAMARVGRLFLRDKRIQIEKARKELKEQALREGKAIDGIANVLKALIEPIEEYLEHQEKFVEIKAAEEAERKRIEEEQRLEAERIAKEKAEAEERERIRIENDRLKKEAEERERKIAEERKRVEAEKRAAEEKSRLEHEAQERELAETRRKAEAEKRAIEEKATREKAEIEAKAKAEREKAEAAKKTAEEKSRREKERLQKELASQIECPYCHKKFQRGDKSNAS